MNFSAKTLGANILAHRKYAGLTQEQLASQLNVSFQTVSKWENGKSIPDALLLPVIANIFSCSIDDLFSYKTTNRVYYNIPNEFLLLWQIVEKERSRIKEHLSSEETQIIAMFSSCDSPVYMFVNNINSRQDEESALQDIARNNCKIDRILCMWAGGEVDLPPYSFRKRLLEINSENKSTQILLMGEKGFNARSLGSTMP